MILKGTFSTDKLSLTLMSWFSKIWLESDTYFLSWETWKTLYILNRAGGRASQYTKGPTLSSICKVQHTLDLTYHFFQISLLPRWEISSKILFLSDGILKVFSLNPPNSYLGPAINFLPTSSQYKRDLYFRPYNASNGVIPIPLW